MFFFFIISYTYTAETAMPPRATRTPKKDSVTVAVKKNLMKPFSPRSRVSRRKQELVPQDVPEWQQQVLKTAAAAAKLQQKTNTSRKTGKRNADRRTRDGRAKSTAKSKTSAAKKGKKAKNAAEDGDDTSEATASSNDDDNNDDDTASAAAEQSSEASAGNARGRGNKKASAKQPRKSADDGTAAPDRTPSKRTRRPKAADLLCPRCKLRMDQWPFCGLSGEPHVVPGETASPTTEPAAAAVEDNGSETTK